MRWYAGGHLQSHVGFLSQRSFHRVGLLKLRQPFDLGIVSGIIPAMSNCHLPSRVPVRQKQQLYPLLQVQKPSDGDCGFCGGNEEQRPGQRQVLMSSQGTR
jgi:hypothetical protein